MPNNKYFFTDGQTVKGIDLIQYPDSAWDWITGEPKDTEQEELYSSVAAVFRVANMTADAVANMPFALYQGEEPYDTSNDWQNKVGFMPDPRQLLRLWRMSLFMTNTAYGFMGRNNVKIKSLKYLEPSSISIEADKESGIKAFKRRIGNQVTTYPVDANVILYFHWLDHTTEVIPSKFSEFKALMQSAGALYYSDYYINNYFQRGAIDPTILEVSGVPTREDKERIETTWDKFVRGWRKLTGMVIQSEGLKATRIGTGIDSLKDSSLHEDKLSDIAMAAGMPKSLLVSDAANYATANVEYMTWFRDSVIPKTIFMQDTLNEQLFRPLGLHLKFLPEITNTGTQEESERAGAYRAYVLSGLPHSIAAQITGIDMPEGVEYDDLDKLALHPVLLEQQARAMPSASDAPVDEVEDDSANVTTPEKSAPTLLTIEQLRELELWQSFAFRKLKQGKSLDFPFVCKQIPESVASGIRERLPDCKNEKDIEQAFQLKARDNDPIKELAEALNKAADSMRIEAKPSPQENEERDEFLERCIPEVLADGTAEDNEQAVAVCVSMWEERNKDG